MEWENHEIFSSKVISTPKTLQSTNWDDESFNLCDMGNNSSTKSSISASTESSFKEGIKVSNFSFGGCQGSSVSSNEPFIGLKLGKRTYFENNLISSTVKKVKPCSQTSPIPCCQVEGCNLKLSSAKEYHRKHRVCEIHSKCPKVVVNGLERRFCQQCSRFHSLSEFDEKKRSCRRRLSDHNARRRKPQQETIEFNSTNLSSSFYGGRQQLSFVLNNAPVVQIGPDISSTWENSTNFTYSIDKMKTNKSGPLEGIPHLLDTQFPNTVNMPSIAFNRPVPSKGTIVEILDQGFKESLTPNVDALDIRRALSLLSNNSRGLYDPDLIPLENPQQPIHSDNIIQHGIQSIPQGLPLLSPDYYQSEQQSSNATNSQFQEFQLFNLFYSNPMDEILKPI